MRGVCTSLDEWSYFICNLSSIPLACLRGRLMQDADGYVATLKWAR